MGLATSLVVACVPSHIEKFDRFETLDDTVNAYREALRWGYFDRAFAFKKVEEGEVLELPAGLEAIQITYYEVVSPPTIGEGNFSTQTAKIRYINVDTQREYTVIDRQVWEYHEDKRRWLLVSPLPEFKL